MDRDTLMIDVQHADAETAPAQEQVSQDLHRFKDGLGYKLSRAAKVAQDCADDVLKPLGLTRLSWTVLATVAFDGFRTPGSIATHIGIERTAVSRILRQLEAVGLIGRQVDERDGRGFCIELTPSGVALCNHVPAELASAMAPFIARLSADQRSTLCQMLDTLASTSEPVWHSESG